MLVEQGVAHVAIAIGLATLSSLQSPADFASKGLKLDLECHASSNLIGLIVNLLTTWLGKALTLTDLSWLERFEGPKSTVSFALTDQETLIKKRN